MSYVDDNLVAGEVVVHRTAVHWARHPSWMLLCLALVAGAILARDLAPWGLALGILAAVLALFFLARAFLARASSELAVTNRRVIVKLGLLSRRTLELNLEKLESISVDQDLTGRLIGYGTILLRGSGGTHESFVDIEQPLAFKKAVNTSLEQLQHPRGG